MTANLVVPLDGSSASRAAIPVARALAQALGATVHVVHISEPRVAPSEAARRLGAGLEGAVVETQSGSPATAILDAIRRWEPRAVVMSAHCGHPRAGHGLGGVAEAVLSGAEAPVFLVRPERGEAAWEPHLALFPLDGSPDSANALRQGLGFVRALGGKAEVLHVAESCAKPRDPGTFGVTPYADQPQHEWPAWGQEFIERAARGCACCDELPLQVAAGSPAAEALRSAREHGADLIVVGWHGQFQREHAGTVQALLAGAPCPVLVVRV